MAHKYAFISFFLLCCSLQQQRSNADFLLKTPFNHFSLDVFNKVAETNEDKNVLISPLYIRYVLTLAYLGARGATARELESALGIVRPRYKEDVAEQLATYVRIAESSGGKLLISNNLLINDSETVSNNFKKFANIVGTKIQKVDFYSREIPGFNNSNSILVAVDNNISLQAEWYHSFQRSGIKGFISPQSDNVLEVDFMGLNGYYKHFRSIELKAHFLQLHFRTHKMSMIFVLPDDVNGLAEVEHKLARTDLDNILNSMVVSRLIVYMPKFNITTHSGLQKPLERLGIHSLYNGNADFGDLLVDVQVPIVFSARLSSNFRIDNSGVSQSSHANIGARPYQSYRELYFNHPFAYFIRTKESILLAGHLVNPLKSVETY